MSSQFAHHADHKMDEFSEGILSIERNSKTVKGGRKMSFSAYVAVGDKKGQVGIGHGKATEVPEAIRKAIQNAKTHMIKVPMVDGTIPHEVRVKFCASHLIMKPASEGTGILAGGVVKTVLTLAGYENVMAKSIGSRNIKNVGHAVFKALSQISDVKQRLNERRAKEVVANV